MTNTILMCEPKYFGVSYEINPWMSGNIGMVDKDLAIKQWNNLANEIAKYATITLVDPIEGLPDMVFTANAAFVFENSGSQFSIVSKFRNIQRRGEERYFKKWFVDNGFCVRAAHPNSVTFEGAGDCLMSEEDVTWLGHGFRSSEDAKQYITDELQRFNITTKTLQLCDERFYHLDTCFCPLEQGYVMYFQKAFDEHSSNKIISHFGRHTITVDEEDAINFSCNAVNIGNKIILNKASDNLKRQLHGAGFDVIEIDMSEFMKSGGSVKCLTLKI